MRFHQRRCTPSASADTGRSTTVRYPVTKAAVRARSNAPCSLPNCTVAVLATSSAKGRRRIRSQSMTAAMCPLCQMTLRCCTSPCVHPAGPAGRSSCGRWSAYWAMRVLRRRSRLAAASSNAVVPASAALRYRSASVRASFGVVTRDRCGLVTGSRPMSAHRWFRWRWMCPSVMPTSRTSCGPRHGVAPTV